MLRPIKELKGYRLSAEDGELGSVRDVLFDDRHWTVRYLVASTGPWLLGRRVLIALAALGEPEKAEGVFPVALTRAQVKSSPPVDADAPVSRQMEEALNAHYGWTPYWLSSSMEQGLVEARSPASSPERQTHLRSAQEVLGYTIVASDGELGHIEDLIFDDQSGAIRSLVAHTEAWRPGLKVLISPEVVEDFDWFPRKVVVKLTGEQVRGSPRYDPDRPIEEAEERGSLEHDERPRG